MDIILKGMVYIFHFIIMASIFQSKAKPTFRQLEPQTWSFSGIWVNRRAEGANYPPKDEGQEKAHFCLRDLHLWPLCAPT